MKTSSLCAFASVALLLAAGEASAQTPESRARCATRLSMSLLGRAPSAALLSAADPQLQVNTMLTTPEFIDRLARFANERFNNGQGETPAEDATYYLARHVLQNNLPWRDLFIGQFRVVNDPAAPATNALVQADVNGLGYFRSIAWKRRYAGNEIDGYRLVAAYRIQQNLLGLKLVAAVATDGVDAAGRLAAPCNSCHYDTVFGLDKVALLLDKKTPGSDPPTFNNNIPSGPPQSLLGGITVADDKALVTAIVGSLDYRFNACRLAVDFAYGRPEYKCEGTVFDACMSAFPANGKLQDAIAAVAKHSTFCQ